MTIQLVLFLVYGVVICYSIARPEAGFALALLAGRHLVPSRDFALFPLALALLVACFIGWLGPRRSRGDESRAGTSPAAVMAAGVLLWLVWSMIGLTSGDYEGSLGIEKALYTAAVTIPLILLAPKVCWSEGSMRRFELTYVVAASALGSLALAANLGGSRTGALGGGPIVLAQLCFSAALLVMFSPRLREGRTRSLVSRIGLVALLLISAVATNSRFPIVAGLFCVVLAGTAGGTWINSRVSAHSRVVKLTVFGGGAAFVLWALTRALHAARFDLLLSLGDELQRSRLDVWEAGVAQANSAGLIGHGIGSFPVSPAGDSYAHNLGLEAIGEGGLLLGVLLILLILAFVWRAWRSGDVYRVVSVFFLACAMVSGDLYNSRFIFVFAILALHSPSEPATTPSARAIVS